MISTIVFMNFSILMLQENFIDVNALLVSTFCIFFIFVPAFYFYYSLNQLTHDILVLTVSQLMEKVEVADETPY